MRDKPLPYLPPSLSDRKLVGARPYNHQILKTSEMHQVDLSDDLLNKIFAHLNFIDLCKCAQMNKQWHRQANQDQLWYELCSNNKWFTKETSWKAAYAKHYRASRNWLVGKYTCKQIGYENIVVPLEVHTHIRDRSGSRRFTGGLTAVPESLIKPVVKITPAHSDAVLASCLLEDNTLVTGSKDGRVKLWDLDNNHQQLSMVPSDRQVCFNKVVQSLPCPVYCVAQFDNYLVAGLANGDLKFYNKFTGELVAHLIQEHLDAITDILVLSSEFGSLDNGMRNSWLVTSSFDGTCRSYCLDGQHKTEYNTFTQGSFSITLRSVFEGHLGGVFCLSQYGTCVASAGYGEIVRLWNPREGEQESQIITGDGTIVCLKSQDVKLITGSIDGHVSVYDQNVLQFKISTQSTLKAIALQENLIFTSTFDGLVKCWQNNKLLWFIDLPPGEQEEFKRTEVAIGCSLQVDSYRLIAGDQFGRLYIYDFT